MKDTEFKKALEGKDLTKAEDFKAVLDAINASESSTVIKKENTFNEKYQQLEASRNKDAENWKNKAYIYQKINNELNDEDVSDLMTLVNARMSNNEKLKFEDAVKEVSNKRGFYKKVEIPKPVETTKSVEQLKVEETKKVEAPKKEEKPINVGVRSNTNSSLDINFEDKSTKAQLERYKRIIGKAE